MENDIIRRHAVSTSGISGQPMLFAHGFGCDQSMWRFVAPEFEQDHQVILFDHMGSGDSDTSAYERSKYSSLHGYADDIVEIARSLDLEDSILVGHSVSAMIALLAAKKAPELFARLILVVPSACYINHPPHYTGGFSREDLEGLLDLMQKNYLGWASFLAPVIMKNEDRPELAQELEQSFCRANPEIAQQFAEVTFLSDHRDDIQGIATPSLILQCEDDAVAPPSAIEYVHSQLETSVLRKMEATGHCPHVSHPSETIAAIRSYLNADGAGPAG